MANTPFKIEGLEFPNGTIQTTAGGGVEQREIDFPQGADGDTVGTIALNGAGQTYICTADYVTQETVSGGTIITTNQDFNTSQTGQVSIAWNVLLADYPIIAALMTADGWQGVNSGSQFGYSHPEYFTVESLDLDGVRTCTSVIIGSNGIDLTFYVAKLSGDLTVLPTGSEAEVGWDIPAGAQPAIWKRLDGSSNIIQYTDQETNYTSELSLTYDFDVQTDNSHATFNGAGNWDIGSNNYNTKIFSTDELAPDPLDIIVRANNSNWMFDRNGGLTFPNGTIQTTAYTGQGGSDSNIWVQTFVTDDPIIDLPAAATSIEYDSQGNVIALFSHYQTNNNNTYSSVAKFDSAGTKLWSIRFSAGDNTDGWGLAVDNVGGYIYVVSNSSQTGSPTATLITQLDSGSGDINWGKTYDLGGNTTLSGVVIDVDSSGNPVFVGYGQLFDDRFVITVKISKTDGSVTWNKVIDGQGDDQAYGMAVGPDGEIVTIGYVAQQGAGTDPDQDNRMLVVKYANDGTLAWQKTVQFDSGFDCSGADADIDSSGNIYVCGNYQRVGNNGNTSAMSIVKFNSSGVKQWSRRVVGDCEDLSNSIVVGPDDCLYVSGVSGNNSTSDFSLVIAKYFEDGRVDWQRLLDNTTTWAVAGVFWSGNGGGSNFAVRDGYVAIGASFGVPFGQTFDVHAVVAQISTAGTQFVAGDWDFKGASFSGVLNGTASDITVLPADKTSDSVGGITVASAGGWDLNPSFLIGTRYRPGGGSNTGDITFDGVKIRGNGNGQNTSGSIELVPNPTLYSNGQFVKIYPTNNEDYPHVHISAGENGELYIGTDQQYVKTATDGSIVVQSYSSNTGHAWLFGNDGQLYLPINGSNQSVIYSSTGNVRLYTNHEGDATVDLRAKGAAGDSLWSFDSSGSVLFPSLTSNNRTGTGENLKFAKSNSQKIISTGAGTADNNTVERLVIAGGDSYQDPETSIYAGEGGDIYLWAGRGDNGGDIKVDAGDSYGTYGGDVKVRGGSSYAENGLGGFLELRAGNGTNTGGTGGPVNIYGGYGNVASGAVNIHSGNNTWAFSPDGRLLLGANAGVIYTDQNTGSVSIGDYIGAGGAAAAPSNVLHIGGPDNVLMVSGYAVSNPPVWTFGNDGNLTAPGSITAATSLAVSGTGGSITFSDATTQSTAYKATFANTTPATSTSTGVKGDIQYDNDFVYICVAANTWIKSAVITSW